MIITTRDGKSFDTETDLTPPERHILQKLFLWKSMVSSLQEFRNRKDEAFFKGWNNSGQVSESPSMKSIIHDMEQNITDRLSKNDRKTAVI